MSSYESMFSCTDSSSDEEYDSRLNELEEEKLYNESLDRLSELLSELNIRSPLNGPIDGYVINRVLKSDLSMDDVLHNNKLRYTDKVPLGSEITSDRIIEFRRAAAGIVRHYAPYMSRFSSYIDGVTACLIKYHFKL